METARHGRVCHAAQFPFFLRQPFARVLAVAHGQDAGEARAEAAADGQRAEGERSAPLRHWPSAALEGAPRRTFQKRSGVGPSLSSVVERWSQSGGSCLKRSHSFRHRPPLWLPHWERMETARHGRVCHAAQFPFFSSTAFARVLAVAHGQDAGEARAEAAADGQRAEGERSAPLRHWPSAALEGAPRRTFQKRSGVGPSLSSGEVEPER